MAKASPAPAERTPRPSTLPRSSASKPPLPRAADVSSSSSATTTAKGVAKRLAYDDDDLAFPDAPLLDLPDPADSITTLISAAPEDASDSSALTEVAAAPADPSEMVVKVDEPLPEQITLALAELHAGRGLSPASNRLVTALVDAVATELSSTATAVRLRRALFWRKVRIGIVATTLAAVAAIDVALAVALLSFRRTDHQLPPT
uniref:Uncharacterized protein n=1 Tax=Leersia perrieri TaxID=77586 RepID=A0A0D9VMZ0_9ORYZ